MPRLVTPVLSRAFTFIEATVTFIIIAIISGIAITSYQWAVGGAHDADATQSLQAAALASGAYYAQHSNWPTFTAMPQVESAYAYVNSAVVSTGPEQISVGSDAYNGMLDLTAYDNSTGTCFFLAVPIPGSGGAQLQVSSKTITCSASTIVIDNLNSASGSPWP